MAREADHYNVGEVGRILGVSPARVRQMLRAGELEGERGPEPVEGVPGPWRVSASAVHAFQERHRAAAEDADTTVALPPGAMLPGPETVAGPPAGGRTADTPTVTSERLSEGVSDLRNKAERFLADLDRLEGQLEAAEVEQLALREALRREKERADTLQAELEVGKAGPERGGEARGGSWRRLFGG